MMRTSTIAVLVAGAIGLSSCDKNAETPTAETSKPAASTEAMPSMAMPVDAMKTGKATGTVTAIDAATGKITLDHGAIPSVGWPAMTMTFSAKPTLLAGITVGDEVNFEVTAAGAASEVTWVAKR